MNTRRLSRIARIALFVIVLVVLGGGAWAQPFSPATPQPPQGPTTFSFSIGGGGPADQREQVAVGLQILALLTILTLAPAILMMLTSFVRIAVVLGFVRRAIGTQEVPPNQVILGLALFLTFFVMAPTFQRTYEQGIRPYLDGRYTPREAYEGGMEPVREFLFAHTRKTDLSLFINVSNTPRPRTKADVPSHVLIPAFMISELKTAFIIGFIIYVPFLIIDMVVSSILLSMGMMMMPPVIISLPFKVLLFVLVDGWGLVVGSLVRSF